MSGIHNTAAHQAINEKFTTGKAVYEKSNRFIPV
jgi:hypothetical protein